MSKIMHNLVVLMEPSRDAHDNSLKAENMILNRFCIDEDAAFELSGVNYLKKSSYKMNTAEIKVKGMGYSFLRFETVLLLFYKLYLNE